MRNYSIKRAITLKNKQADKLVELLKSNNISGSFKRIQHGETSVSITIEDKSEEAKVREFIKYAKAIN